MITVVPYDAAWPGTYAIERDRRPYHVHVCAAGGDWARRTLGFRDLLRRDAAARTAYQQEKLRLAAEHDDVLAYTEAKTPIIRRLQGASILPP